MKTEQPHPLFAPPKQWSSRDLLFFLLVAAVSSLLLLSGLSVRSLWGSEGRWAVVVREMILSGNYFLPTVNGEVYFDKPLMSYWAILPFAWTAGVSEACSRLPSALAGIGSVLLIFAMGRRLFGLRAGLWAAGLLLTSAMYILWTRTASAELLNLLSIWVMLWAFMAGGVAGRIKPLLLLFATGAVSAFLKGPVAPAVGFSAIGFYSIVRFVTSVRSRRPSVENAKEEFFSRFRWIASWQGMVSILFALCLFGALFLLPVLITGSWQSAELMWRENVQRFFKPFDHVEPVYAYFKYVPVFFLPWTLLLLASLWDLRKWGPQWTNRWAWLTGLAIFIFFTASGSRRSYYILPLMPALALITGKAVSDWLAGRNPKEGGVMRSAMLATATLTGIAGLALLWAYFSRNLPHHPPQFIVAVLAIAGSATSLFLLMRNRRFSGASVLFSVIFVMELWGFTGGMATLEEMRTFRPFCLEAKTVLENRADGKIALFPGGDSSLVFYLERPPLRTLKSPDEAADFLKSHPEGVVISETKWKTAIDSAMEPPGTHIVLEQKRSPHERKGSRLVLLSGSPGGAAK